MLITGTMELSWCGYRFQDMQYTDLRESLPDTFDMLLVASADKWMDGTAGWGCRTSTPNQSL